MSASLRAVRHHAPVGMAAARWVLSRKELNLPYPYDQRPARQAGPASWHFRRPVVLAGPLPPTMSPRRAARGRDSCRPSLTETIFTTRQQDDNVHRGISLVAEGHARRDTPCRGTRDHRTCRSSRDSKSRTPPLDPLGLMITSPSKRPVWRQAGHCRPDSNDEPSCGAGQIPGDQRCPVLPPSHRTSMTITVQGQEAATG